MIDTKTLASIENQGRRARTYIGNVRPEIQQRIVCVATHLGGRAKNVAAAAIVKIDAAMEDGEARNSISNYTHTPSH